MISALLHFPPRTTASLPPPDIGTQALRLASMSIDFGGVPICALPLVVALALALPEPAWLTL